MSMKIPIMAVVLASIFGFAALITIIVNLCSINNVNQVKSTTLVRLGLILLAGGLGWFLFKTGSDDISHELENISALKTLASCSDAGT